jgi:uncharacterized membrane protein YvbJ
MAFCNKCGVQNTNDKKFCISCGNSLIQDVPNKISLHNYTPTEPNIKHFDKKIKSWRITIFATLLVLGAFIIWYFSKSKDPTSKNDELLKSSYSQDTSVEKMNLTKSKDPLSRNDELLKEMYNQDSSIIKPKEEDKTLGKSQLQIGYYIVNSSDTKRVYFHNAPDEATKRKAYLSTQETVYVQNIQNGFGYIEFTNSNGQSSLGWVEMKYLIMKPN